MRITYKNKSKDVRQKALDQMRKLRNRFEEEHPELLQRIRDEVKKQPLYDAQQGEANQPNDGEPEKIDYKKNLTTIMKFVELHDGSDAFQSRLKSLLIETVRD